MPNSETTLGDWAAQNVTQRFHPYPVSAFSQTVLSLCRSFGLRKLLEIGAGRTPLFDPDDLKSQGIEYHINDISQEELNAAPGAIPESRKACFDVAANSITVTERYDLVYSKSVLEHVSDGLQAWRNSYAVLQPGGIAFHFFPTLFSSPFVANKLLPERLTAALLENVVGGEYKKFPAKYDQCRSSTRLEREIAQVGFSSVLLVPFWGHDYYERIPVLRTVDAQLHALAASRNWRFYSSYCYGIARR